MVEYLFRPESLMEFVDAIGLNLIVRKPTRALDPYTLEADTKSARSTQHVYRDQALSIVLKAAVIDSYLLPTENATTAVRLHLAGNLQLLFLFGHNKNNTIECYVLDGSKIESKDRVFMERWSRLRTLYAIRNAVVGHYTYQRRSQRTMNRTATWLATPNAKKFVQTYLLAREVHKLTSGDAEVLAEHVAFGRLADDDDIARKWKISTNAKREEMLADHAKAQPA